jgi:hypothetical protein
MLQIGEQFEIMDSPLLLLLPFNKRNREELDQIIAISQDSEVVVFGKETVVYDKDALVKRG